MRLLAADCGGTRSSSLLIDDGQLIAEFGGGPGNFQTFGPDRIADLVKGWLAEVSSVDALAVGVAGVRTEEDRSALARYLHSSGVGLPVAVFSDIEIALSAANVTAGIVLVAGTGSAALAIGEDGGRRRSGGWGSGLGDEGSAFWIGRRVLSQLIRDTDEGRPVSQNSLDAVLLHWDADSIDVLRVRENLSPERVAALLPAIVTAARSGDKTAKEALSSAADELARLVRIAAHGMSLPSPAPVVLTGGVFAVAPEQVDALASRLGPHFACRRLEVNPAWGAYRLARERDLWEQPSTTETPVATEQTNEASRTIDRLDTVSMLRIMNDEDRRVAPEVGSQLAAIAKVVDEAANRMKQGGRLVYAGAGTSGRLAMLDAVECVPTFGTDPGEVVALVAGGVAALTGAVEGAEDDAESGRSEIAAVQIGRNDAFVAVSASGGAAFVIAAARAARDRAAFTACVTCNPRAPLIFEVDVPVVVDVGPEVIAGSSRLKAGTAQKLVLNMISTGVMIKLGRTTGNRMTRMRPTNAKLRRRAIRLVQELSGGPTETALMALENTDWDVRRAALLVLLHEPAAVEQAIRIHGGDVGEALDDVRHPRACS